jgi:integrase
MKVLGPIWNEKPETASRVRGRIESVLGWATTSGYRTGENPARWRGHIENVLPKMKSAKATVRRQVGRSEHFAALPYPEIGGFMAELREQEGVAARALEFVILTAARTGEALGATWPEIDEEARLWVILGDRTRCRSRAQRWRSWRVYLGIAKSCSQSRTWPCRSCCGAWGTPI